jgi:hypothetical protein
MTNISEKETFKVPDGYDMAGTEFKISDIKIDDHPDGSGEGILTYELYHDDEVDGTELGKVVNQVLLDALTRQLEETKKEDKGSLAQLD